MQNLETKMWRNVHLFGFYKIFTKRVFLPLISVYASTYAGLSISQIGIVAASASAVSILFETTTGFWADKHGRRRSARLGSLLAAIGTSLYVIAPSFVGIMCGSILIAVGYSFLSGAMEALIHDSLLVLKRGNDYAKIASRAQSIGLVGNAFFLATVPLLYPIDPRLPFLAGVIAYVVLFSLATFLTEPPEHIHPLKQPLLFIPAVRQVVTRKTLLFFVFAGFTSGIVISMIDLLNLGFVELGVKPEQLGLLFAVASLVAAAFGLVVHHLKRLTFHQFASIGVIVNGLTFTVFGLIQNRWAAITMFIISMSLWRYERTMYHHYILQAHGDTKYKATLLSVSNNFQQVHEVWLVLLVTGIAQQVGVLAGLSYGVLLLFIAWPLLLLGISQFLANSRAVD